MCYKDCEQGEIRKKVEKKKTNKHASFTRVVKYGNWVSDNCFSSKSWTDEGNYINGHQRKN